MLEDVREHCDHITIWLRPDIKKALYVWETDEGFKHRRLTNRANRASTMASKYTGGSATFMKKKAKLSKSLDHEATMVKTFKYTHTLKENKRLETATQQSQRTRDDGNNSAASVVDPDRFWREAASKPYKNRVYGLGSCFADNLRTSTLIHSSSSTTSRPVDPEDGVYLREHAQQLWEFEERYQAILSRMTDTNDLGRECRRELEWLQRIERHMVPYEHQMHAGGSIVA
ncbi:hypothetical protein Ahy_B04g072665 [Arachis hypogaea]|uniref:Uncharacterized protein n=1 Tax=Arachis hypogaea TaxID=3818 RepID=A0A444ZNJ2_ARAHY|nr:hypothetical protein Ahy_B04g072665 [Arachis hypogaea]